MTLIDLAKQIFDKFDKRIREAVAGTIIPARFVAGLIANEAGKDRKGNIVEAATRFEPHVYKKLKWVAQTRGAVYGQITHNHLKDATDDALRALAHSYGPTQMMGYWCIILGCTLADLRNPDKHFFYCVKLLLLNDQNDFNQKSEAAYDDEMRQWNTGREKGKTYHEDYVPNARVIRREYAKLEETRSTRTIEERVNIPIEELETPKPAEPAQIDNESAVDPSFTGTPEQDPSTQPGSQSPAGEDPNNGSATIEVTEQKPTLVQVIGGKFKAIYAALPTAATGLISGVVAWAQGARLEIIICFFASGAIVGMTVTIGLFWLKNQREKRAHEANEKEKDRVFEINRLKLLAAADKGQNNVELV